MVRFLIGYFFAGAALLTLALVAAAVVGNEFWAVDYWAGPMGVSLSFLSGAICFGCGTAYALE